MFEKGDSIPKIELPSIDGTDFNSDSLAGTRFLLSFYRFASCPFCNLRVNEMVRRFNEFGDNFTMVAIFDSPLDNLVQHASKHKAPFPILADATNTYYKKFGIQHSVSGLLKGMIIRMPTMIKGMMKGYVPLKFKGSLTTMPADFLLNEDGIIEEAYYGKDEGDHLPFEQVKAFSMFSELSTTGN